MREYSPDYNNVLKAAKNVSPDRTPLYEHMISEKIMEQIMNKKFADLYKGSRSEKKEFFKNYNQFFKSMGYDTVSMECCIGYAMPGSGALGRHMPGVIKTREDFEKYPWSEVPSLYFGMFGEDFELLGETMPEGMKAIGGVGNGVFECVQEIVGYENLCYISIDDPELYADLFKAVGNVMFGIWEEFLNKYSQIYCVCRFGDDLGFKNQTLIPPNDIKNHVIPQYARVIELVHSYNKPFLLHSCGKIFDVMEDLINVAKIDAKHSNEDQIAPFSEWVDRYGSRIGNFGGVDTDHLCRKSEQEIKEIVKDVMNYSVGQGGFALSSGNSIPAYVPPSGYLAMIEAARTFRGE
jgi:Uroporphyrinogen-III decarboxylase